ncbi:MAG TPA: hypothetical protein VFW12_10850 [Candidatus Limnocylindria bacterium]|nr:hypothetical protein [Candidatus Limnocylindria bacterium]
MARKILGGIPPLRFGEGQECSFPASLAAATKSGYDWVMGCSGTAFVAQIDEATWDPLAATPRDDATLARGAAAVGVRLDAVTPPYDDDLRALVLERVKEQVDGGIPPLARGLVGAPEYGLIVGYDDTGPTFLARTYFDRGPEPTRVGWEAFVDSDHGTPVFLDPAPAPDRARAALAGIDAGLAAAGATEAALQAWSAGLRDDARWADAKHAGAAAFADHSMRVVLADKRRAAARFLRGLRAEFPTRPGADLLRAAESYGYVADVAEKHGTGAFDGSVAMRFADAGHRRGWAKALEAAIAHEREAVTALRSAREALA